MSDIDHRPRCHWSDCDNDATEVIRDVSVKPAGSPSEVFVGDVEVCAGHLAIAERLGRVVLDWDRIFAAIEGRNT